MSTPTLTEKLQQAENKIYAQVQHYLSDSNLRWDKYMREKLVETRGSLAANFFMNFKKLAELLKAYQTLQKDADSPQQDIYPLFLSVLEKKQTEADSAATQAVFTFDKEKELIVRTNEFKYNGEWFNKTIYLKFNSDDPKSSRFNASCFDQLVEFFSEFGAVQLIRQRQFFTPSNRNSTKKPLFKDAFLIEFDTLEHAEAAVEGAQNKLILGLNNYNLLLLSKHTEARVNQNKFVPNDIRKPGVKYLSYPDVLKNKKSGKRDLSQLEKDQNTNSSFLLGYKASFAIKADSKESTEPKESTESTEPTEPKDLLNQKKSTESTEPKESTESTEPTESTESTKGTQDLNENKVKLQDKIDYKIIKEAFRQFGPVVYIKRNFGSESGAVVFKQGIADEVLEKINQMENGSLVFDGISIKPYKLSPQEEEEANRDRRIFDATRNSNKRFK
ncbi:hypothetical protein BB561_001090 [Smittium simulii]|uniref:HTH La-type RNA-binding domain-containing protein n=1 Tax=Smittium simulii TaxID=133385 RepID=A0A2T9YW88_9FUNG|nr:hypothetical protein BB561_001090 [Smittium simulii]